MSEYIFLPLHEKRGLSEKADHNYNASMIDMIGEGRLYIIFGGLRVVKETREQILGLYEKMSNEEERLKLRKKVKWQAEKKGLPLSSLILSHGFLQYPPERVLSGMEKIPVDEKRNIYLYRIPENGKWCQGADWVSWDGDIYHYIPSPVWGAVYETREEALTVAWKFLGVERKAIQLDLFGGDYS